MTTTTANDLQSVAADITSQQSVIEETKAEMKPLRKRISNAKEKIQQRRQELEQLIVPLTDEFGLSITRGLGRKHPKQQDADKRDPWSDYRSCMCGTPWREKVIEFLNSRNIDPQSFFTYLAQRGYTESTEKNTGCVNPETVANLFRDFLKREFGKDDAPPTS